AAHPNPETLGNCAQCLLWLNRYEEAATAARLAQSLTRERSVSAHAVLAHVLLAHGQPAEAEAMARSGLSDVEALLPFAQSAHRVSLLAALCRAERALDDPILAHKHLRALQKAARHNPFLEAQVLMEEADELASGDEAAQARALALLERASHLAPHYVCWHAQQPATLFEVRSAPRYAALIEEAHASWTRIGGPSRVPPKASAALAARIASQLAVARERGSARPAAHQNWDALAAQGFALLGTLALLVWWTWRFFLAGA
ncbi:MAG TPA: hypothetical protein VF916_09135, partial [Ktedonobacterales bacterium]